MKSNDFEKTNGNKLLRILPGKNGGRSAVDSKSWFAPTYTESRYKEPDKVVMEANRCTCALPESPMVDYYKVLKAQIEKQVQGKGWNTIMVTSVNPGEGKTLTAINLALTFTRSFNETVLLVDCDFRKQGIYHYMGIPGDVGLIDVILDDKPLNEVITWCGIEKMTLISGGQNSQDSVEILASSKMAALVAEIKNRYKDRYVIFDLPPVLNRADTIAFARIVDCILIVVESEQTSMKDIEKVFEVIPKEKVIGFVLNKDLSRN